MFNPRTIELVVSQAAGSNYTSPAWDIRGVELGFVEVGYTGFDANDATLQMQASWTGAIWANWGDPKTLAASCQGTGWNLTGLGAAKVRFVFTANSNTAGSFTIVCGAKVLLDNGIPGA